MIPSPIPIIFPMISVFLCFPAGFYDSFPMVFRWFPHPFPPRFLPRNSSAAEGHWPRCPSPRGRGWAAWRPRSARGAAWPRLGDLPIWGKWAEFNQKTIGNHRKKTDEIIGNQKKTMWKNHRKTIGNHHRETLGKHRETLGKHRETMGKHRETTLPQTNPLKHGTPIFSYTVCTQVMKKLFSDYLASMLSLTGV